MHLLKKRKHVNVQVARAVQNYVVDYSCKVCQVMAHLPSLLAVMQSALKADNARHLSPSLPAERLHSGCSTETLEGPRASAWQKHIISTLNYTTGQVTTMIVGSSRLDKHKNNVRRMPDDRCWCSVLRCR